MFASVHNCTLEMEQSWLLLLCGLQYQHALRDLSWMFLCFTWTKKNKKLLQKLRGSRHILLRVHASAAAAAAAAN